MSKSIIYLSKKFWLLSAFEKKVFISAICFLPFISLFLSCMGFKRLEKILSFQKERAKIRRPSIGVADLKRAALIVETASLYCVFRSKCLEQGVFFYLLACRYGVIPELKVGVNIINGQFESHAWVSIDDSTVIGGQHSANVFHTIAQVR